MKPNAGVNRAVALGPHRRGYVARVSEIQREAPGRQLEAEVAIGDALPGHELVLRIEHDDHGMSMERARTAYVRGRTFEDLPDYQSIYRVGVRAAGGR
jgi:hypothetical protein